jgi:hypothetical protein
VIALGGVHLRGILQAYARYYNDLRTHRSLDRRAILAPGSADRSHQVACCSRWTASPVHASLSFRYTQVGGAPTFWAPLRGRYIRCGVLPRPAQRDMRALDQSSLASFGSKARRKPKGVGEKVRCCSVSDQHGSFGR